MRILLVSDYAHRFGGAEMHLFQLRDLMRRRGHDARVFTSSAGGVADADYSCAGTLGPFRTLLQSANPHAAHRLRAVLRSFRPDVVHVKLFLTQLSPLILPALADVPSLYHAVWYRAVCPTGIKMLPDRTPCRVAAGAACYRNGCVPLRDLLPIAVQMRLLRKWRGVFDRVVANSATTRDVLVEGGFPSVAVIPNGVPVVPARPPLTGPPLAAFAGRLVLEKGVDLLLRAFVIVRTRIPDARLLIVGEGPERQRLDHLTISLGLRDHVTFEGQRSPEELESASSAVWVQAVPSVWAEPFGLVAAEAAMRGTAVIASNSGALPDIVHHERTGLLVPPNDVDAIANALIRVLANRGLAESLGAAGRLLALGELSGDLCADRFEALYEELSGATPRVRERAVMREA